MDLSAESKGGSAIAEDAVKNEFVRAWLRVSARSPVSCARCGYQVGPPELGACPECGHPIRQMSASEARWLARLQRLSFWLGLLSIVVIPIGALLIAAASRFDQGSVTPAASRAVALLSAGSALGMAACAVLVVLMAHLLDAMSRAAAVVGGVAVTVSWILVPASGIAVGARGWSGDWYVASLLLSLGANLWLLSAGTEGIERALGQRERARAARLARWVLLGSLLAFAAIGIAVLAMYLSQRRAPIWLLRLTGLASVVGLGAMVVVAKHALRMLRTRPP